MKDIKNLETFYCNKSDSGYKERSCIKHLGNYGKDIKSV